MNQIPQIQTSNIHVAYLIKRNPMQNFTNEWNISCFTINFQLTFNLYYSYPGKYDMVKQQSINGWTKSTNKRYQIYKPYLNLKKLHESNAALDP